MSVGKVIPFPVIVRGELNEDGSVTKAADPSPERAARPYVVTVDVRRFTRALAALLFAAAGANCIFTAVASVYILGFDQLFALAALLVGFILIFTSTIVGGRR